MREELREYARIRCAEQLRNECQVHAVHARALLRIASSVITTTAQIDALNWPG